MRVVFLIGPPCCGKTTQASLLHEKYAKTFNVYFSVSAWLQDMATSNSDLGKYILNNPTYDALESLVTHRLYNLINNTESFIIDGYPRTAAQATQLPIICHGNELMVIELMCSPQQLALRGAQVQRPDDTPNAFQSRMQFYSVHMQDIRQVLQGVHPRVWQGVDANGSVEDVQQRIASLVASDAIALPRVPIQPLPNQVINAQISYALPLDAAVVVQMTLRLAQSPRLKRNFCGSYPVSIERNHLEALTRFPYMVSLKIDGIRMFALTWRNRVWFVNRKMDVFEGPACLAEDETLLDCEYVPQLNRFCVCDCIAVRGEYVGNYPLLERLQKASAVGKKLNSFFRPQEFVPLEQLRNLWKKGQETQRHIPQDGLVFTPAKLPYRLGIDYKLFKWKEAHRNTIDILLRIVPGRVPLVFCRQAKIGEPVHIGRVVNNLYTDEPLKTETIYECRCVGEAQWEIVNPRPDKLHPNLDWVVNNVLNSIKQKITLEEHFEISTQMSQPATPRNEQSLAHHRPTQAASPRSSDTATLLACQEQE